MLIPAGPNRSRAERNFVMEIMLKEPMLGRGANEIISVSYDRAYHLMKEGKVNADRGFMAAYERANPGVPEKKEPVMKTVSKPEPKPKPKPKAEAATSKKAEKRETSVKK